MPSYLTRRVSNFTVQHIFFLIKEPHLTRMTLVVLTVNSPVKTPVALQLSWDNSLLNRAGSNWPLSYSNRTIHTNGLSQLSSQGVSVWNRHPNYPQPAEAIHAGCFLVASWQWGMKKNSIHPRRYLIFSANCGRILSLTWGRVYV